MNNRSQQVAAMYPSNPGGYAYSQVMGNNGGFQNPNRFQKQNIPNKNPNPANPNIVMTPNQVINSAPINNMTSQQPPISTPVKEVQPQNIGRPKRNEQINAIQGPPNGRRRNMGNNIPPPNREGRNYGPNRNDRPNNRPRGIVKDGVYQKPTAAIIEARNPRKISQDTQCYACGQTGHMARECKAYRDSYDPTVNYKQVCTNCGERGHLFTVCKKRKGN